MGWYTGHCIASKSQLTCVCGPYMVDYSRVPSWDWPKMSILSGATWVVPKWAPYVGTSRVTIGKWVYGLKKQNYWSISTFSNSATIMHVCCDSVIKINHTFISLLHTFNHLLCHLMILFIISIGSKMPRLMFIVYDVEVCVANLLSWCVGLR